MTQRNAEDDKPNGPRVLDVGQCALDHAYITRLLTEQFAARVDEAHTADEAIRLLRADRFALVLVNRILDEDRSDGVEFIRQLKGDERTRDVPVMLVSNYVDAQAVAVAAGAVRGFGKGALRDEQTLRLLAEHLGGHDGT